jgi:hypothetical protein
LAVCLHTARAYHAGFRSRPTLYMANS